MTVSVPEALKKYREMVLKFNSNSKDYAGTVDVFESPERKLRIVYRKYMCGRDCLEHESDNPFVRERISKISERKTVLYPSYWYRIYKFNEESVHLKRSHQELGLVKIEQYFDIPELFLRGVCFGEKINEKDLHDIIGFYKMNKYNPPVKMIFEKPNRNRNLEPGIEDKINIITGMSKDFDRLLDMLYQKLLKIKRFKTPVDKIDTLIIKQKFEEFIPVGEYYVEGFGCDGNINVVDLSGPGISFDYEGERAIDATGGKFISPFLAVVATEKPEEIRNLFNSYAEFETGLNEKLDFELEYAKHSLTRRVYRYSGNIKDCKESVEKGKVALLKIVKDIMKN